jgi:hypothetical protein
MNEPKARQGEGYDLYDYAVVAYNAGGGVEVPYVAGAQARAAIPGLGVGDTAVWPISETFPAVPPFFPGLGCPHNAQNTEIISTTPTLIRLVSREMIFRWLLSLAAGAPFSAWPIPTVQIQVPANTLKTIPDKWAVLYVVAQGGQLAGTLRIKASG